MKIQFEGDVLVGNHGAVVIRNWTIKADPQEQPNDVLIQFKTIIAERLELAAASLRNDVLELRKAQTADYEKMFASTKNLSVN